MLARDYLNLSLIRLQNGSDWHPASECLTFVFPTSGAAFLQTVAPVEASANGNGNGNGSSAPQACADSGIDKLQPGDVLVLNGALQLALRNASSRTVFAFSTFSLCTEHLFPLFAGRDVVLLGTIAETFREPKYYPANSAVALECHSFLEDVPPRFDIDHRSHLLRAASAVFAFEFKTARARRHAGFVSVEEHVNHVLESLSVTEILESSVDDLAAKFGCTTRHLNRLFHRHFGFSVAAFKMEMRLLKAASLLCDPSAKVIHVASKCGFNFLGQFNICFKRRFGTSPGEWRKHQPGAAPPSVPSPQGDAKCRMRNLGLCPWSGAGAPAGEAGI